MDEKILITIPFWSGDRDQALALGRLLADLEPAHSELADLMFICRFDSKNDDETVRYVSRKFNASAHKSPRRSVGWPHGCNGTFFGTLERVYSDILSKRSPHYKAIFIAESDGGPLAKNWIQLLSSEWDRVRAAANNRLCMAGHLIQHGGRLHINGGCCLIATDDFLHHMAVKVGDLQVQAGWDWHMNKEFEARGWSHTPMIRSEWRTPTFTTEHWNRCSKDGVVWFHGVKDNSLITMAREILT